MTSRPRKQAIDAAKAVLDDNLLKFKDARRVLTNRRASLFLRTQNGVDDGICDPQPPALDPNGAVYSRGLGRRGLGCEPLLRFSIAAMCKNGMKVHLSEFGDATKRRLLITTTKSGL